jgi:tetratricopeptide (TPR) repeat protein
MNRRHRRLTWLERLLWTVDVILFHLQAWVFTRRLGLLAQGLPALLLAAGFIVLWAGQGGGPDRDLISRYDLAVEQSLAGNDLVSAKVCVRKLVLLDEPGPRTRYALARLAEHEGDLPRAGRLMSDLAPNPGSGYPAAHFWVAQRLLGQQARRSPGPSDSNQEVIHHLEQSLQSPDNRQQAHQWLAELYLAQGDAEQAAKYLEEAAPQRPELYLQLAEVQLRRQDSVRFQRAAKQALDHFQTRAAADAKDVPARISWARVCSLDGKLEEAEKILQDGLAGSDDASLRQALTQVYLAMADRLDANDPREMGQRLELLGKALRVSPDHPEVVNRLAMFIRYSAPLADAAREQLRDLLVHGQLPATVHLLLGSTAAADGRQDVAELHLEQAYRLDSRLPALLNHLAWALTQGETPDLERALRLADEAVKLAADQPEMRATRGRILARLQRWQDALADLEAVLASRVDQGDLHAVLVEVYTALGDPEMAERHRTLADEEVEKSKSR